MINKEILKKIKQLEIHTKRILSGSLVGDYSTAIKGSGFEFDQIRDYQHGDDVRFIDWKSSSRMNKLLVKQYLEERNRTICLVLDASSSGFFGSGEQFKYEFISEIAGTLALVSEYGKDLTSLIIFSEDVDVYIPPGKGNKHVKKIMESIFSFDNKQNKKTNLDAPFKFLAKMNRRDTITFFISDFIADIPEKLLKIVSKKYDCIAIRCLDKNEIEFPEIGLIDIVDPETSEKLVLSTNSRGGLLLNELLNRRIVEQNNVFKKNGVDLLDLRLDRPFIGDIVRFFRKRLMY